MKVGFLTSNNIYEKIKAGGGVAGEANLMALEHLYSEDNVYKVFITGNVNRTLIQNNMALVPKHKSKIQYLSNNLFNLSTINRKAENDIVDYLICSNVDVAFIDSSVFGKIVKKLEQAGIPCVVYFHNIEKDYMKIMMSKNGMRYITQFNAFSYNERLAVKYSSCRIVMCERDKLSMKTNYGISPNYVIPMTYKDRYDKEKDLVHHDENNLNVLFVGSAILKANVDGVKWFIENVMHEAEHICLTVVGKGFEKYRNTLSAENVDIVGAVEDVDMYYYMSDVVICPIFWGSGMKTKTAEALMFGRRILATNEALQGYEDVEGMEGIFRCNNVKEFVEALNCCMRNPDTIFYRTKRRNLFLDNYESRCREVKISKAMHGLKKEIK